jgi:hypothetical protein
VKYAIAIFVTAVLVFLGATLYYKGLPTFPQSSKNTVSTQSGVPATTSEVSPQPSATESAVQTADENISIVSAVQAGLVAEHGPDAASMSVTISKVEGDYAKGMAGGTGGGGIWFAAKANGVWKLVWDGNGIITCSDISAYPAFPADMIPQCWDTATQKSITR